MVSNIVSTTQAISNFLFLPANPEKSDLIFVFGHSYLPTMDEVKKLYDRGFASRIMIAGYSKGKMKEREADRFFRRGVELGIPESAFILERESTNTKENIRFSLPILEKSLGLGQIKKILFVCKTFHTRRVFMTARNFLPKHIKFCFYPVVDDRDIRPDNWWRKPVARQRVLEELKRIGEYSLQGDLSLD